MKLISFKISGEFAAFRDPSVTANQLVYYIPSKSAVIGILGAMIGIKRSNNLGEMYGKEYQEFFKNTRIGIELESKEPKKVTFFTNHRSFKEAKTKPFKTELLQEPTYTIYVKTDEDSRKRLLAAIGNHRFVYSPYLGHAYCQAVISDLRQIDADVQANPVGEKTRCVVLDESETYNLDFKFKYEIVNEGSIIIERHTHHFFNKEELDGRVLKHLIPINDAEIEIRTYFPITLVEFYKIGEYVVCTY